MASQYETEVALNASIRANPLPWLGLMRARQHKLADEERADQRARSLLETKLRFEESQSTAKLRSEEAQASAKLKATAEENIEDRKNKLEVAKATAEAHVKTLTEAQKAAEKVRLGAKTRTSQRTGESIDDYLLRANTTLAEQSANTFRYLDTQKAKHLADEKKLITAETARQKETIKNAFSVLYKDADLSEDERSQIKAAMDKQPKLTHRGALAGTNIPAARQTAIAAALDAIEGRAREAAEPDKDYLEAVSDARRLYSDVEKRFNDFAADPDGRPGLFLYSQPPDQPGAATLPPPSFGPLNTGYASGQPTALGTGRFGGGTATGVGGGGVGVGGGPGGGAPDMSVGGSWNAFLQNQLGAGGGDQITTPPPAETPAPAAAPVVAPGSAAGIAPAAVSRADAATAMGTRAADWMRYQRENQGLAFPPAPGGLSRADAANYATVANEAMQFQYEHGFTPPMEPGAAPTVLPSRGDAAAAMAARAVMPPPAARPPSRIRASDPEGTAMVFGPDAPVLMTEAIQLAESRGITGEQFNDTYLAAMQGDAPAKEEINAVLNYLRKSKGTVPAPGGGAGGGGMPVSRMLSPMMPNEGARGSLLGIPYTRPASESTDLGPAIRAIPGQLKAATVGTTPDGRTTFLGIPGTRAPGMRDRFAQLFGPDAPDLLGEAATLANANGISQEQQNATINAAMAGDETALGQVSTVLNYLRQAKSADAGRSFYPGFDPSVIQVPAR